MRRIFPQDIRTGAAELVDLRQSKIQTSIIDMKNREKPCKKKNSSGAQRGYFSRVEIPELKTSLGPRQSTSGFESRDSLDPGGGGGGGGGGGWGGGESWGWGGIVHKYDPVNCQ